MTRKAPQVSPIPESAVEEYLAFRRGSGLSPATLDLDRFTLIPFARDYPEWTADLRSAAVAYLDDAARPWTRATRLRVLRSFVGFLIEEEFLPEGSDPLKGVRAPIPGKRAEATTEEGVRSALAALGDSRSARRMRAALILLADTGLRRGELCALLWADVDFASRTIRVRAETTKTRRDRFVPLSPGSIRELRRLRADNESRFPGKPNVFLSIEGNPLRPATLGLQVRRFCAAHGIDLHLHGLRHLAATHVVRATGSLTLAAKLLGHTKISTTAGFYEHLTQDDLREAHEKAGMLDGILSRRKPGPKGNPR